MSQPILSINFLFNLSEKVQVSALSLQGNFFLLVIIIIFTCVLLFIRNIRFME